MKGLIDQSLIKTNDRTNVKKLINYLVLLLGVSFVAYTIYEIISFKSPSPWLPIYTRYFLFKTHINISFFIVGALLPSCFLTLKRKYLLSIIFFCVIVLIGVILKDSVHFDSLLYEL